MSWFDTLFRWKKKSPRTQESAEEVLKKNTGGKIQRDIQKKRKEIVLTEKHRHTKNLRKITAGEKIFRLQEQIKKFGNSLGKRHISIILLVLFLSFVIYGVGFVIRTEKTIKIIQASPEKYTNIDTLQKTVHGLWRDYQILGLVADNSPLPLEPLTSYWQILKNTRLLIYQSDRIQQMMQNMIGWKDRSQQESIFPLLDTVWAIGWDGIKNIKTLMNSAEKIAPLESWFQKKYIHYLAIAEAFLKYKKIWYTVLGDSGPTKILVLNQNNDELRAGGWFPGTVFIVEFEKWKITNISFHDIYEIDHKITAYVPSPEWINQLKSKTFPGKPIEFRVRDANYFPTFAESAKNINALLKTSEIGDIDLVIGINTSLLTEIIHLIGPIQATGIPMKLDKNNIPLVLSMLVESKEKISATPKGIIHMLWGAMIDTINKQKKTIEVAKTLWKQLENGEILLASPRGDIQKALDELGLFDTWKTYSWDFIYPIFTSISNNKTDRIMKRIFVVREINNCAREVTLTQKHGWNVETEASIKQMAHDLDITDKLPILLPIQWSGDNKQYIRFILPPWSILETRWQTRLRTFPSSYKETIIDGYITTKTGGNSTLKFQYTLPKNLCGTQTKFFKQAGLKNTIFRVEKENKILSEQVFQE